MNGFTVIVPATENWPRRASVAAENAARAAARAATAVPSCAGSVAAQQDAPKLATQAATYAAQSLDAWNNGNYVSSYENCVSAEYAARAAAVLAKLANR